MSCCHQVRLLMKMDPEENVPEYDQIFRDDSDSEEEDYDTESSLLRRREKRLWEEEREKLLFSYTRDSYTSTSSALLVYELAWRLSAFSSHRTDLSGTATRQTLCLQKDKIKS